MLQTRLEALSTLAYAAAIDHAKWDAFLAQCSDVAGGGVRTCLFGYDLDAQINLGTRQFGYDPDFERSHTAYYAEKDFLGARMLGGSEGRPLRYDAVWSEPGLRRTEFYADWVRPQEDITGGSSILLFKRDRRFFGFSGSIRSKDADRLTESWNRVVTYLTPHLQQAFEIARTLAGAEVEKQALVNVREPNEAACLVLTPGRAILHANLQAERMLEAGGRIRRGGRHRLSFSDECWDRQFATALQKADAGRGAPQSLDLCDATGAPVMTCRIAPLLTDRLAYPPEGLLFASGKASYLVTLSKRPGRPDLPRHLRERFGLTPNEAQVVLHLAEGLAPKEIAEERGTSVSTVRNQIGAAMSKMEARRQSEIVGIVVAMKAGM